MTKENRFPDGEAEKNKEIHCEGRQGETHSYTGTYTHTRTPAPSLTSRFLASVSLFRDGPDGHVAACSAYPRAVCTLVRFVGLSSATYSHLAWRLVWLVARTPSVRWPPARATERGATATTTTAAARRSGGQKSLLPSSGSSRADERARNDDDDDDDRAAR